MSQLARSGNPISRSPTSFKHGASPGTTTWACNGIALESGQNVLTVTAKDAAKNAGNDILKVTYTPVKCDLNGDCNVDAIDVQILIGLILSRALPPLCDLNGDSTMNVLVLQILANVILGLQSCPQ